MPPKADAKGKGKKGSKKKDKAPPPPPAPPARRIIMAPPLHVSPYEYGVLYFGAREGLQLADGAEQQEFVPRFLNKAQSIHIVAADAGRASSALIDSAGQLYVFGENRCGCLGCGHEYARLGEVTAVQGVPKLSGVSCGSEHLLAVTPEGRVLGCGSSWQHQLGFGVPKEVHSFVPIDIDFDSSSSSHPSNNNHNHQNSSNHNKPRIVQAVASTDFSVFVDSLGHVYGCGTWLGYATPTRIRGFKSVHAPEALQPHLARALACNNGRSEEEEEEEAQVAAWLMALDGEAPIVEVAASHRHILFRSLCGHVYSMGEGMLGKLGHGVMESEKAPRLVEALLGKSIVQVAAGFDHSLFLDAEHRVYACGSGVCGCLGNGRHARALLPIAVDLSKTVSGLKASREDVLRGALASDKPTPQIAMVAAGHDYSLMLDTEGRVLALGSPADGRCGVPVLNNGRYEAAVFAPEYLPLLNGRRITKIYAREAHNLVLVMPPKLPRRVEVWGVDDVVVWLESADLRQHVDVFRGAKVDGARLLALDHKALMGDLRLAIADRNAVLEKIRALVEYGVPESRVESRQPSRPPSQLADVKA